jgi:hypothetical protein
MLCLLNELCNLQLDERLLFLQKRVFFVKHKLFAELFPKQLNIRKLEHSQMRELLLLLQNMLGTSQYKLFFLLNGLLPVWIDMH